MAKRRLDATAPLAEALCGSGLGKAILSVFHATNMLSPFETTRVANMLRGHHADALVRAAATFTDDATAAALPELKGGGESFAPRLR